MKKIKKLAFTLSEIVLVMSIIGVVSVLAITNAVNSTDVNERLTQLIKTQEVLQQAFSQLTMELGDVNDWYTNWGDSGSLNSAFFIDNLFPKLKLSDNCGIYSGCFKDEPQKIAAGSEDKYRITDLNADTTYPKAVLASGASIFIDYNGYGINTYALKNGTENSYFSNITILTDVDGPNKGLNTLGEDIFAFVVLYNGSVAPLDESLYTSRSGYSKCPKNVLACTKRVMERKNMDYKKWPEYSP